MSSSSSSSSGAKAFTLQPWPSGGSKPKNLAEFIARVNGQNGGFRTVTEEGLRKQIEAEEAGVVESADVDMKSDSEDDEAPKPVVLDDILAARNEVLRNIEYALFLPGLPERRRVV